MINGIAFIGLVFELRDMGECIPFRKIHSDATLMYVQFTDATKLTQEMSFESAVVFLFIASDEYAI